MSYKPRGCELPLSENQHSTQKEASNHPFSGAMLVSGRVMISDEPF